MQNIKEIIEKISKVKVIIIGDVMLDRYWWGSVSRISPEAPVPVVRLDRSSEAAGGAANVAANVIGLGAEPCLVGIVGRDAEADALSKILNETGISPESLICLDDHQTTVKTRIIAHSQQVVRLDQENTQPISQKQANRIFFEIEKKVEQADVIIISDYAKGFLTDNLLTRLITYSISVNKKILVDPKGKDYSKYQGATLLTPNQKEAADACGLEENEALIVEKAGKQLLHEIAGEAVLITQGDKGMTLFEKNGETNRFDSLARKVYDVTGAGDTVIATLAAAVGAGLNYVDAAKIANIAAGLVVEQIGTTAISKELFEKSLNTEK